MRTSARHCAILLFDEVELLDFAGALSALSIAGRQWNWRPFKVETYAERPGPIVTRNQISVVAERALDECSAPEVLILPGGYGARRSAEEPTVLDWIRKNGTTSTHVLAVGTGVLLAARAGLAEDGVVAASTELAPMIVDVAPKARIDSVSPVIDGGKLMTARSGAPSVDLALALVEKLLGPKQAARVAEELGHTWLRSGSGAAPGAIAVDIVEPSR